MQLYITLYLLTFDTNKVSSKSVSNINDRAELVDASAILSSEVAYFNFIFIKLKKFIYILKVFTCVT